MKTRSATHTVGTLNVETPRGQVSIMAFPDGQVRVAFSGNVGATVSCNTPRINTGAGEMGCTIFANPLNRINAGRPAP